MKLNHIAAAAILFAASSAQASTIGFTGAFTSDDDKVVFQYTVQNLGPVRVYTTSFATGGFMPILTLFDSTGNFLFYNTGYASSTDADMTWFSSPGARYLVVLTEYDNFPLLFTNNLSDGFTRDGQGNFTEFLPNFPGPFHLDTTQLSGNWAVTFESADPMLQVTTVPEPGTMVLALSAGLLIALVHRRRISGRCARRAN